MYMYRYFYVWVCVSVYVWPILDISQIFIRLSQLDEPMMVSLNGDHLITEISFWWPNCRDYDDYDYDDYDDYDDDYNDDDYDDDYVYDDD